MVKRVVGLENSLKRERRPIPWDRQSLGFKKNGYQRFSPDNRFLFIDVIFNLCAHDEDLVPVLGHGLHGLYAEDVLHNLQASAATLYETV